MTDSSCLPRDRAAAQAAAEFAVACHADNTAEALLPLARMEIAYGLDGVRNLVAAVLLELHRSCPADLRTPRHSPDLTLLVPGLDRLLARLTAAAREAAAEGRAAPDVDDIIRADPDAARACTVHPILQAGLDAMAERPDDTTGVAAAVEVLHPLTRLDLVIAFSLLAIAVRAVAVQPDDGS